MFRALLAAALVVGAFGAALYFSGDYLQAWESPQPAKAQAAPAARKKAKRKRSALVKRSAPVKPARKATAKPAWLAQLNGLCRRTEAEVTAIPPPLTPEGSADYFRQIAQLGKRFNRRAEALLGHSSDPQAARRLVRLFGEDERLIQAIVSAAERRQFERLGRLLPTLVAVGKSENRIFAGLGARDCTLSEDAFDL